MTTAGRQSLSSLADNMKSAINKAWEHGGADFQSRFDKSTAQAQEMKEGARRVLLFTVQFFTNSPLLGNLQIPSILDNVRMIRVDGGSSYLSQHQKYVAAVEESTTGRKKRPL
jgi:hypothetical protein